jgi:hypothetical protein
MNSWRSSPRGWTLPTLTGYGPAHLPKDPVVVVFWTIALYEGKFVVGAACPIAWVLS